MRFFSLLIPCLLLALQPAIAGESNPAGFERWIEQFKKDARQQGISQETLDNAFAAIEFQPHVIELDRKQPETTITAQQYLARVVSDSRIEQGREMLEQNRELLTKTSESYGVPPNFIVALWGIETNYGEQTGNYNLVDSLSTLAYEGRRHDFFRSELIKVLQIMDADHIESAMMTGSWAGAMGQCQFMPSSFLQFAVDADGDGKRDIWFSQEDVFASIANYLSSSGWDGTQGWGILVSLPSGFDESLADIKETRSYSEWQQLGVTQESGEALPSSDEQVSLIMAGEGTDAIPLIVTNNYKVLLKWNRSRYFATAVGQLADQIGK